MKYICTLCMKACCSPHQTLMQLRCRLGLFLQNKMWGNCLGLIETQSFELEPHLYFKSSNPGLSLGSFFLLFFQSLCLCFIFLGKGWYDHYVIHIYKQWLNDPCHHMIWKKHVWDPWSSRQTHQGHCLPSWRQATSYALSLVLSNCGLWTPAGYLAPLQAYDKPIT